MPDEMHPSWPDQEIPGLPLQPEQTGWHAVDGEFAKWDAELQEWFFVGSDVGLDPVDVGRYEYAGQRSPN